MTGTCAVPLAVANAVAADGVSALRVLHCGKPVYNIGTGAERGRMWLPFNAIAQVIKTLGGCS